jgi:hypothetical protein
MARKGERACPRLLDRRSFNGNSAMAWTRKNFGANGTAAVWGAGDFNGDSKSDILWQHDNGTAAIWTMDGTDVLSVGAAGSFNPGADWHLIV